MDNNVGMQVSGGSPFLVTDPGSRRWQKAPERTSPFLVTPTPEPARDAPAPSPFLVTGGDGGAPVDGTGSPFLVTDPDSTRWQKDPGQETGGSQPAPSGDTAPAPVGPKSPYGVLSFAFRAGRNIVNDPAGVAHRTIDNTAKPVDAVLTSGVAAGIPGAGAARTLTNRAANGAHRLVNGTQRLATDPRGGLHTSIATNANRARTVITAAEGAGVPGAALARQGVDRLERGGHRMVEAAADPIDTTARGANRIIDKAEALGVPGTDIARTVTGLAQDGAHVIADKVEAGATVIVDGVGAGVTAIADGAGALADGAGKVWDSVFGD